MARNSYGIAKKSIWYVLRTLLIITAIVGLCLVVFIEGLQVSNLYILVTEGLEKRAEVILSNDESDELRMFFTEQCLKNDDKLDRDIYKDFTVASYDYRIEIKELFVLPWGVRAHMTVDARLAAINASANVEEGMPAPQLPKWEAGRYQVVFLREGSRWYINSMTLLQKDPAPEVKPTPDMSLLKKDDDQ